MKCLIVDDDVICRKALYERLKEVAECEEAVDGCEAVAKFRDAIRKQAPFDVVFLDLIMPGLDGHETAREIRRIEEEAANAEEVKIVVLTVLNSVNDAMKAFYLGRCFSYMVKPASEDQLISTFKELGIF